MPTVVITYMYELWIGNGRILKYLCCTTKVLQHQCIRRIGEKETPTWHLQECLSYLSLRHFNLKVLKLLLILAPYGSILSKLVLVSTTHFCVYTLSTVYNVGAPPLRIKGVYQIITAPVCK